MRFICKWLRTLKSTYMRMYACIHSCADSTENDEASAARVKHG